MYVCMHSDNDDYKIGMEVPMCVHVGHKHMYV